MAPLKARRLESALLAKGFRFQESRHRKLFYYNVSGQPTPVSTLLSHGGNRDVGDPLLAQMARQCRLTRREFDALVRCPLSREAYESRLRNGGHLD